MAIYHADLKIFARRLGHSAVAAAAYRVGGVIVDDRTGVTHDYSVRTGVAFVQTLLPTGAPESLREEAVLWNAVEAAEKRVDARVARELIVALPIELNEEQRHSLAVELGQMLVDRYAVALTLAVHTPDAMGDDRNHHVHLLFSTRTLGQDGFGGKTRVLDDKATGPEEVKATREAVALLTNQALQRAGSHARVDHRSLDAQAEEAAEQGDIAAVIRLSRPPTKHEGKAVTVRKRRGERMDRAAINEAHIAEAQRLTREASSYRPSVGSSQVGASTALRRPTVNAAPPSERAAATSRRRILTPNTARRVGADGSPHAVYLRALADAAQQSGAIAAAYIEHLRVEGAEAARLRRCAQEDAEFALLLLRINEGRAIALGLSSTAGPVGSSRRSAAQRSVRFGSKANAHRRWRAFERRRQRLMPLHSDRDLAVSSPEPSRPRIRPPASPRLAR